MTVILLFWSVSHEYFQVYYPECGHVWRLGDNFVMESVLFYHWFRESNSRLTWQMLYLLNHLAGLWYSLLSRGSPVFQELSFLLGDITGWVKTILGNGLTPSKKGMNSVSVQVYLSAVSEDDCMVCSTVRHLRLVMCAVSSSYSEKQWGLFSAEWHTFCFPPGWVLVW